MYNTVTFSIDVCSCSSELGSDKSTGGEVRMCFSKFEWHCRKRDLSLLVYQVSNAGVYSMFRNVCLMYGSQS